MTVLIDSWAWIEYFKGTDKGKIAAKYIESDERVILATINLAEVFRHFLSVDSLAEAQKTADFMLEVSMICPLDPQLAIEAAKIKHAKKWGLADSIVLATARKNGARVLTGDADFKWEPSTIFIG